MKAVECRCGKRWFPVSSGVLASEQVERLAAMCLCRACSADFNKALDMCPETVPVYKGSAACSRKWAHAGECTPVDIALAQDGEGASAQPSEGAATPFGNGSAPADSCTCGPKWRHLVTAPDQHYSGCALHEGGGE